MRIKCILIVGLLALLSSGCYPRITGKVVDAETGQPIEGAVVLVEWTEAKGVIGLTYTESYKVVEVFTDKEGKAVIPGAYKPFLDYPDVTVYKKGYVAWSSRIIFPDQKNREDFKWRNGYVFKLERFKPEYSYIDHTSFIDSAIGSQRGDKKIMKAAYRWEELEASKERDRRRKK